MAMVFGAFLVVFGCFCRFRFVFLFFCCMVRSFFGFFERFKKCVYGVCVWGLIRWVLKLAGLVLFLLRGGVLVFCSY